MTGPDAAEIRNKVSKAGFWAAVVILIGLRLLLSSDLSVQLNYSPHDDSLYVERALQLLAGDALGPYNSVILVKYPGLSLWLAGARFLGIPFLVSINALYVAAGLYLMYAFLRSGLGRWTALAGFALYLFNPITFTYEWVRVIREPLGVGLLALILGAMAHVFVGVEKERTPWPHVAVLAPAFAFALYVREDDRLLWGLLVIFGAALVWQAAYRHATSRKWIALIASAVLVPAAIAMAYEYSLRSFIERNYGLPIVHELGEGEYPRLLAAIRSIESAKDNRMVMVTQEALQKLRIEVPIFRAVIDRLPPPGPGTHSCRLHGVCTEWSNGWMAFWIKDEAFRAGLTPTLPQAQDYFRRVRQGIERACEARKLPCREKGSGLVPPMELRWTRAYVAEAWQLIKMTLWPATAVVTLPPLTYDVTADLGRKYQAVTMTDYFDTQWQTSFSERPKERLYANPIAGWRAPIADAYKFVGAALLIVGVIALMFRLLIIHRVPLNALSLAAVVFGIYSILRLAALSYVAVYMGAFDPRMVFSTYVLGVLLSFTLLADSIGAVATFRKGRESA